MEESKEVTLENLLYEYDKYILSRLINKEYDFNILRQKVEKISSDTDLIKYNKQMSDYEVAKGIQELIQKMTKGKIFKIN